MKKSDLVVSMQINALSLLLWGIISQFFSPRHNAQIRLLKAQVRILQERLPSQRVIASPEEKSELLRLGADFDHQINNLIMIVKPNTYRRWLNQSSSGKPFKQVGRPRLTQELRDTVIRMAKENLQWRYRRIVGELKKLGLYAGANSVKRTLNEAGIHPEPEKSKPTPPLPWEIFIKAHLETTLACDFFTKDVHTLFGKKTAYVLVFIHLASRRVFPSSATYAPDNAWVTQQARNTLLWCDEQGIKPAYLIRDGDTKFSGPFLEVWRSDFVRVIQIPHCAPQANAFAESFIGTLKRECFNFFICFSRSQLNYILHSWVDHYNHERPHRGVGRDNTVLDVNFSAARDGPIQCKERLGGIIKSYYREAA
ncbi:integrase core domain-containing protein [Magnetococcus sp. PR-3]|uniref:integrase core domain-containing protein n=1 Tax=Magnetococcus sp. PR-3 TaxID=3120355 RepID=UPI002FCE1F32